MLHVIHRLINNRGEVFSEWEFYRTTPEATAQFLTAVIANNDGRAVRYTIDIALPVVKS